jgi:hypothetical protein
MGTNKVFETTKPSRDVWGDFNGMMSNAFLVNLNELSQTETKDAETQILSLITDDTLYINNKGVNQFKIVSYHRFLVTTNKEDNCPIKTSKDDRRNLIIRSSDEKCGDVEYFNKLHALLEDVNVVKICYEYFKSIPEMDEFHLLKIPETEYQNNLKELSISPIECWLKDFSAQSLEDEVTLLGTQTLHSFQQWCENNGVKYDIDSKKLGVRLSNMKLDGIKKENTLDKVKREYLI